jgi:hypothetical protein
MTDDQIEEMVRDLIDCAGRLTYELDEASVQAALAWLDKVVINHLAMEGILREGEEAGIKLEAAGIKLKPPGKPAKKRK